MLHLPQLRLLAAAALADGVVHADEQETLYALAEALDIPKATVREELVKMYGRQAVLCPPSEKEERQAFFEQVVLMVLADGVVHDKERAFLHSIGPAFGHDGAAVDATLEALKDAPQPRRAEDPSGGDGMLRKVLRLLRGKAQG